MAVANDTIIKKMINELHQANEQQHNHKKMVKHIANVRLLCELFLEEDSPSEVSGIASQVSQAEWKAMLGEDGMKEQLKKEKSPSSSIDHDGANGDSLFDF